MDQMQQYTCPECGSGGAHPVKMAAPFCHMCTGRVKMQRSHNGVIRETAHDFYDREDGLAHCKVCGGAEGSLPTDCPGRLMTAEEQDEVYAGARDFRAGFWRAG